MRSARSRLRTACATPSRATTTRLVSAIAAIRGQQRAGNPSERQVSTIIQNAEKYLSRLPAVTETLSLEDALQVRDNAEVSERRQLPACHAP
jgi:hypothetical protein